VVLTDSDPKQWKSTGRSPMLKMTLICTCTAIALAIAGQEIVLAAPRLHPEVRVKPEKLPKAGGGGGLEKAKERANELNIRAHETVDVLGPAPTDKEESGHLHWHTHIERHDCNSSRRSDDCPNKLNTHETDDVFDLK
jgi:hypothetical protein